MFHSLRFNYEYQIQSLKAELKFFFQNRDIVSQNNVFPEFLV